MLILSRNKHVRVHALSVMEICLLLKNDQENSDPDTYPLPSLVVTVGRGIEPRTLTVLASPALLTSSALLTSPARQLCAPLSGHSNAVIESVFQWGWQQRICLGEVSLCRGPWERTGR